MQGVAQQRQNDQNLRSERVVLIVVGSSRFEHQTDGSKGGKNVNDLQGRVVDRYEVRDQIHISGDKNEGIQDLGSPRDTDARLSFPYLPHQDYDSHEMSQIADQAKTVYTCHGKLDSFSV